MQAVNHRQRQLLLLQVGAERLADRVFGPHEIEEMLLIFVFGRNVPAPRALPALDEIGVIYEDVRRVWRVGSVFEIVSSPIPYQVGDS